MVEDQREKQLKKEKLERLIAKLYYKAPGQPTFDSLPEQLVARTLQCLDPKSKAVMAASSRRIYTHINEERVADAVRREKERIKSQCKSITEEINALTLYTEDRWLAYEREMKLEQIYNDIPDYRLLKMQGRWIKLIRVVICTNFLRQHVRFGEEVRDTYKRLKETSPGNARVFLRLAHELYEGGLQYVFSCSPTQIIAMNENPSSAMILQRNRPRG